MNSFDELVKYKRAFETNFGIIESLAPSEKIQRDGSDHAEIVSEYKKWKSDAIKILLRKDDGYGRADVDALGRILGGYDKKFIQAKQVS